MITKKRAFGDLGEEITAKYLKSKGYVVLSRNYLKSFGELDIVASKEGIFLLLTKRNLPKKSSAHSNLASTALSTKAASIPIFPGTQKKK